MDLTHLTPDPAELALAKACFAGDRKAQHVLWKRYKNPLFGVCLRFAGSRPEAEDLLQEVFIGIFQSIGNYRGEGSLEGWMKRIAVRTALQQLQKKRLPTDSLDEAAWEKRTDESCETWTDAEAGDEPGRLVSLLHYLPPGFRAVLNLYVVEEYSHEEIARELGISVGTSKSQLHRAKAFLRRLLDKTLFILI